MGTENTRKFDLAEIFLLLIPEDGPNTLDEIVRNQWRILGGGFSMKIQLWHPLSGKNSTPYPDLKALFFQFGSPHDGGKSPADLCAQQCLKQWFSLATAA